MDLKFFQLSASMMALTIKLSFLSASLAVLLVGCSAVGQPIQGQDLLSTIPADPHQIAPPHWVTADIAEPNPYLSEELTGNVWKIDTASVKYEQGWTWVWERFIPSPKMGAAIGIQVAETYRGINCQTRETTEWLHRYRRTDGTFIREGETNTDWDLHKMPAIGGPYAREVEIVCSHIQGETVRYQAFNVGSGIRLSVPSTWTVVSEAQKDQMHAELRRYIGNEVDAENAAPLLFQAVSGPGWEVEALTINVKTPASFKPSDIRRVAAQLPRALSGEIEKNMRELLQRVGSRLTRFEGTKIQEFSGHPAAISSYEYAKGTSRKRGRLTIVFTDTSEITITQSTPVERGDKAMDRMDRIRNSILVP
ncbi:hypothetical protein [Burkholderia ubonensis]|uniref:hypothetical protein n=1 Tax=Burkholderia ubonensis TaxID=101571 RepID=UPI0012FCFDD7|nr:hypothetical protein [Burkholderia ubonensis]